MKLTAEAASERDRCFHPIGHVCGYPLEACQPPIRARAGKRCACIRNGLCSRETTALGDTDELNGCAHRFGRVILAHCYQASFDYIGSWGE